MSTRSALTLLGYARLLLDAIEAIGAEHMLGGALAVVAWAEARSTQDVDLVLNLPVEVAGDFSQQLETRDVLIPTDIILDHLIEARADLPLSAIHLYSGHRADIFLLHPGDRLRQSALARRRRVNLGEPLNNVYVHSPEDLILYKLHYFSISEQDKHVRDITSILNFMGNRLDFEYLEGWVQETGLKNVWQQMQEEARRRARQ